MDRIFKLIRNNTSINEIHITFYFKFYINLYIAGFFLWGLILIFFFQTVHVRVNSAKTVSSNRFILSKIKHYQYYTICTFFYFILFCSSFKILLLKQKENCKQVCNIFFNHLNWTCMCIEICTFKKYP